MKQSGHPRPFKKIDYSTGTVGIPENPVSPVAKVTRNAGIDWRIFWRQRLNKAGIFEVNFVARTPEPTPGLPHLTKVMEVFGSACHHIEGVPEFVSAGTGWRYWVLTLTAKETIVESLLLGPASKCGCDPWLNARTSGEVYESLREWLQGLNQV